MTNLVTTLLAAIAIVVFLAAAAACRAQAPDPPAAPPSREAEGSPTAVPDPTPTAAIQFSKPPLTGKAAESFEQITRSDPLTAQALAGLPWLADEITLEERLTVDAISEIAGEDPSLARRVVGLPWLESEVSEEELSAVIAIGEIAGVDPGLAREIAAAPWLADGVGEDERSTLLLASDVAKDDIYQARQVVESQGKSETGRFYLESIQQEHPRLAESLLQAPWVADGVDDIEGAALSSLRRLAGEDPALAQGIAASVWVADGVDQQEVTALFHISGLAGAESSLGRSVAAYPWVADGIEDHEMSALGNLLRLARHEPAQAALLASQNWFQDGLTGEEAALVVSLRTVSDTSIPFEEMVSEGATHSKTLDLPSGEVELYVVHRSSIRPDVEEVFAALEKGIRAIEDFMGEPWIKPEVIVHLEPDFDYVVEIGGANVDSHLVMKTGPGETGFQETLSHELAHFYTKEYYMPHWLSEGWSDFLGSYTLMHNEGADVQTRYTLAVNDVNQRNCPSEGASSIHELLEATKGRQYLEYLPTPLWGCHYPLGESFLLGMYLALGHDGTVTALRGLYHAAVSQGSPVSEDEIYFAFLENTPPGKVQQFHAMYRCLHGRPIPGEAPVTGTECDPLALAAELSSQEEWTAAAAEWVFVGSETPLHRAMFSAPAEVVQRLLDQGGEVNATTGLRHRLFGDPITDVTPLHLAAQYNGPEVTALLLDRGAGLNARDSNDRTPLHQAARNKDPAVAALLLDRGSDVNSQARYGETPLHTAAERNSNPEVAGLLIDRGADVNARGTSDWGYTPLLNAARHNPEPEMVSLLIDRGADINLRDQAQGAGPLHHAAFSNTPEVVSLFLERGAGVGDTDDRGRTPLHYAMANHRYEGVDAQGKENWLGPIIVTLLLERGADPNAKDNGGRTPLQPSFGDTNPESVALLLEQAADINAKDDRGWTALHLAAIRDRQRQVRELLELGADTEARSNEGLTPLHLAAGFRTLSQGAEDVVQVLLDAGVDINAKGDKGRTPLHYAAAPEPGPYSFPLDAPYYKTVVPLLLDRGADVNAEDYNGITPCQRAQSMGAMTGEPLLERLCFP